MHVAKRDWLILRGRLRAFASLALLPISMGAMGAMSGCAIDTSDDDADKDERATSRFETTATSIGSSLE